MRNIHKLNPLFAHLVYPLTLREEQILLLAVQGLRNPEIASSLGTSEDTIKHQMSKIYDKTGMGNRVELTNWYRDQIEKQKASPGAPPQCPEPPTKS